MPKGVIFDVDGTLVDSVDLHAQAWDDAFRHFKHTFGLNRIRDQIGKGGDQLMPVFLSKDDLDRRGEEIERYRSGLFKERYLGQVKAFPAVRDLFCRLLDDGKKIALASSAKGAELEHYKEIAQIADLIDTETSSDDAEKSKPYPDIFQAALDRLQGIEARDVIIVGDTPYDAEAAANAGIASVGLRSGGWSDAALKEAGCVAVYDDVSDLLENLGSSPLAGR